MPIILKNVGFEWPNGEPVFNNLNLTLDHSTQALVGPNGVGKTTLARIVSGALESNTGSVERGDEKVYFFPQHEEKPLLTLSEYLMETNVFEDPLLLRFLKDLPFEQSCQSLSGGEWARVRLVKASGLGSSFLILDEPTNHLDRDGREVLKEFLQVFQGGILLISHDREILEGVQKIFEISSQGVATFSGGWTEYSDWREREREELRLKLHEAKKLQRKSERHRQEKIDRASKRQRQGQKNAPKSGLPKILLGARKRNAEVTLGKIDQSSKEQVQEAVKKASDAYERLKVDPVMFSQLPAVDLPQGKLICEARDFNFRFNESLTDLWENDLNFVFYGSVRVAVTGANGSGKSTLLTLLQDKNLPGVRRGILQLGALHVGFLDQDCSNLADEKSVLENLRESVSLSEADLRNSLATFLFFGDDVYEPVGALSGGERLRLAMAKVLLQDPVPSVLILDEPTNNLDMANVEFLEELLKQYQGALIVVSHDKKFLENLEVTTSLEL